MLNNLIIGVFQFNIFWEDIQDNQRKIEGLINSLSSFPDVIILPEMYSTGFVMEPGKISRSLLNKQIDWQKNLSVKTGITLMGSLVVSENEVFHNRFLCTTPENSVYHYDKKHLFSIGKENSNYVSGTKRVTFPIKDFIVMPLICYDLRFPVWSRNNVGYDLLIYTANWPSQRQNAWEILLKSRAVENQSYVIGVNRVGKDKNNINYVGGSLICGPEGNVLMQMNELEQYTETLISYDELMKYRERFPVLNDVDNFEIKNRID